MDRVTAPPVDNTDLPKPWEDRQITRAGWQKHRAHLMSGIGLSGTRPDGWWLYERNMQPPIPMWRQPKILFEMGEFVGPELEHFTGWWRGYYGEANKLKNRRKHPRWEDIPDALIEQWDTARRSKQP